MEFISMEYINEDILALIMGVPMITWLISTLLFGRISMKHLDREMKKEGMDDTEFSPLGGRIPSYTRILARNKPISQFSQEEEAILRHARTFDRVLAKLSHNSFLVLLVFCGVGYFLFGPLE